MAMLWCDGFELATLGAVRARYTDATTGTGSLGTSGGRTNQYFELNASRFTKAFTNTPTVIIGIARKLTAFEEVDFLKLLDSDGNVQAVLREMADGTIRLYRGDPTGAGVLLATTSVITPGFWMYYELKYTVDNTAGAYEFRINEESQFSSSGVDTQATIRANVERVTVNGETTTSTAPNDNLIDDYYIANAIAPVPAGLFFGNTKVEHLSPNGPGAVTGWAAFNDSNWRNVDENPHNSDTDYNYSATVNQSDLYTLGNLSTPDGRVRGVMLSAVERKDDSLTRQTAPLVRTGGVTYEGGNDSLTTSYAYYYEVWSQNPQTASEWSVAAINSLEIGIKTYSG